MTIGTDEIGTTSIGGTQGVATLPPGEPDEEEPVIEPGFRIGAIMIATPTE